MQFATIPKNVYILKLNWGYTILKRIFLVTESWYQTKNLYPVEDVSSSFLDKVIDTIETCLVVSSLPTVEKMSFQNNCATKLIMVNLQSVWESRNSYGRRPSSSGSHMSVISVDPMAVFWWRPAILLWTEKRWIIWRITQAHQKKAQ